MFNYSTYFFERFHTLDVNKLEKVGLRPTFFRHAKVNKFPLVIWLIKKVGLVQTFFKFSAKIVDLSELRRVLTFFTWVVA